MLLDFSTLDAMQIYKAMSRSVIPRPIAWIVTEDAEVINVAPFSYFTPLSSDPPSVIVSIGHKTDGTPKDTLANIRKNKKATVCFVNEASFEAMRQSAEPLPKEQSEVEAFGMRTKRINDSYPPIVVTCNAAFLCTFLQEVQLGGKTIPLILQVDYEYVDDDFVDEKGDISIENIARVGKTFAKTIPV